MSHPNVTQGAELYPNLPLSAVKIRVIREIRAKKKKKSIIPINATKNP
jgi:hypothetical protein